LANCPTAHRRKEAERKNAREIYGSDNLPIEVNAELRFPELNSCSEGWMSENQFLLAEGEKYFFLDIPFYRTSPPPRRLRGDEEVPLKPASYGIRILRARSALAMK
jgi:hypothetical protein